MSIQSEHRGIYQTGAHRYVRSRPTTPQDRDPFGAIELCFAFLLTQNESSTHIVGRLVSATTWRLCRQVVFNRVMDEFGRCAELKFAEKSGAVGADGLDTEGDLIGDA